MNAYSLMNENNNPTTMDIPLINSLMRNFTRSNPNAPQNKRERNEELMNALSLELRDREDLIKNFEAISKELIIMGFSPNFALRSFLALKYKSIEEAVELLSKNEEGLWNHKFIEGEDNLCFICEEDESQHRSLKLRKMQSNLDSNLVKKSSNIDNIIFEKKLSSQITKESKREFTLKINVNSCQICFLEVENENKFNLQCKHQFCKDCIIEYLKEEIKNARVSDIKCPTKNCIEKFTESEIKNLVTEEDMYKYKKFLQRAKIKDDNSIVVCPIVDCEGFAKKEEGKIEEEKIIANANNENEKEVALEEKEVALEVKQPSEIPQQIRIKYTCDKGHNFCSACCQAWHGDTNCDTDREIKDFATYSGFIVKKCAQCKVWTEKNEGCNHMTCKVCQFNWCWICEAECPPDHYLREGTPCYGKQFNGPNQQPEDLQMMLLLQGDSIFIRFFVFYILTFVILKQAINSLYGRNENAAEMPPRPNPPKLCTFLTLFCLNVCIMLTSLLFNSVILLTMIVNMSRMAQIRNACAKVSVAFTFLILFFIYFIIGGPVLTLLWFVLANFYVIIKLCLV